MPLKKWIFQYSIALPLVFLLLAGVQYLKGRTLGYAIEFGIMWSFITVGIFAIRRAYNFRKHIDCQVCRDLPEHKESK
ncbi:hypothetical protein Q4561_18060 [Alteromonas sp. 1_MG-2023]|uniref:hypothetical protein n=1 Tax=Alteromonas sp. 1_MG-2023 TaxID=3062669 RepID=UPI0026E1B571|nr:hypothetical protein [Alteromonas sp. 1_MG-2023]MDO6568982.1 hypothetical protein [Alteromonas sp. 1_MG-2023]